MKLLQKCLLFGAVATLLPSCADESPFSGGSEAGEGQLRINLHSTGDINSEIPKSKAEQDISSELVLPNVEDFRITLTKDDGSYNQTWTNVAEFEKVTSFPVGTYQIEATYGHEKSQGLVSEDEEGHEHAYYYATDENVVIKEGETTNVHLVAALANSVVKVEYTEAFQNYFKSWNSVLKSKGEPSIDLGSGEATCYIVPGEVDVIINAELQNGNSVSLNPTSFEAKAKHLYKLRYNVNNGDVGNAQLTIKFNDSPDDTEDVVVDLSDDVLNAEAPVITTVGFNSGESVPALSGADFKDMLIFNVVAEGGIKNATMTITPYKGAFLKDGEIDLCEATEQQKADMATDGLRISGFYDSLSTFGQLDLSGFCRHLNSGKYTVELMVSDALTKTASAKVEIIVEDPDMEIKGAGKALFGSHYADVNVSFNGDDPTKPGKNPFSFKVEGESGWIDAEVQSIKTASGTRSEAFPLSTYTYRISVPSYADKDAVPVKLVFNSVETSKTTEVELEYPKYEVEYDAFAKKMRLRLKEVDGFYLSSDNRNLFSKRVRFGIDKSGNVELVNATQDQNDPTIYWLDKIFEPKTQYNVVSSLTCTRTQINETTRGTLDVIETEEAADLPYLNFANGRELKYENIQCGGKWAITGSSSTTYTNYATIDVFEPLGWATLNDLTFNLNSQTKNTWFLVPSSFLNDDGSVTIRTVGYSHNGTEPSSTTSDNGELLIKTPKYLYCTNTPSNLEVSIGELYFGSYSLESGIKRDGVQFKSRPNLLSLNYIYDGIDSEKGEVTIIVYDNNKVIAQGSKFISSGNEKDCEIEISGYEFGKKADKIYIGFKSSVSDNPQIHMPSGSELDEGFEYRGYGASITNRNYYVETPNTYKSFAKGSELKISNLKINY